MPVPNVNAPGLARLLQFGKRRVIQAEMDKQRHATETLGLTGDAQTGRRLAAEMEEARAAAAEREQRLAATAAEAQRLAAEAEARHAAAAEEAECLTAEAAKTQRLAAMAEAALQQHISRTVAEPEVPAALGSAGVIFADWEHAFIAQMEKWALLQLIAVRAQNLCALLSLQASCVRREPSAPPGGGLSQGRVLAGPGVRCGCQRRQWCASHPRPSACVLARSCHALTLLICSILSSVLGRQDGG